MPHYSFANDLINLTDANTNHTSWGYDQFGNATNKVDATGTTILTYQYDADNRLTNRWSIGRTNTAYGYDNCDNLTSVTYPSDTPSLSFSYDGDNRMTSMSDGIGTTSFSYTQIGQLATETGPWASDQISYFYGAQLLGGFVLQQPNAAAWKQYYNWDAAGRLNSVLTPIGNFQYFYFGGASNSAYTTPSPLAGGVGLANGANFWNGYDVNARLATSLLVSSADTNLDYIEYGYDQGNRRTNQVRGIGSTNNEVLYRYDSIGQVTSDSAVDSATSAARLNEQLAYAYDPAGNLTARTNNALVQSFQVNALNELTNNANSGTLTVVGTTTSYATNVTVNGTNASEYGDSTFAATNMPLTASYTAVAHDSYGRWATNVASVSLSTNVTFQYDGNGNLTSDSLRSLAYNDENQLIQVLVTNQWMSQFTYDGKMRRRIRKDYSWNGAGWVETNEIHYVYDGNLVVQERDMYNTPTVLYIRGVDLSHRLQGAGGIGGLLGRYDLLQHQAAFYFCDGSGNVRSMINSSNALVAKYVYDAFGNVLSKAGLLADANVYRFSSKEADPNSGLVYYLYRYYDPNLQRWLNRDPVAEKGFCLLVSRRMVHRRSNLYRFVRNFPTFLIDKVGLDADACQHCFDQFQDDEEEIQDTVSEAQDRADFACAGMIGEVREACETASMAASLAEAIGMQTAAIASLEGCLSGCQPPNPIPPYDQNCVANSVPSLPPIEGPVQAPPPTVPPYDPNLPPWGQGAPHIF